MRLAIRQLVCLAFVAFVASAVVAEDKKTSAPREEGAVDQTLNAERARADLGNADDMFRIGLRYYRGNGVEKDYKEAAAWFRKASDAGDADSMTWMGLLHARGHGVPKDYAQAKSWYEKAAAKDEPVAMNNLGDLYFNGQGRDKDSAAGVGWYRKSAEKGDA